MSSSSLSKASARLGRMAMLAFFAFAVLVLLVSGCGRTSLEPEDIGLGGYSTCSASSCPDGCCDADGVCQKGGDLRACGSVGAKCSDCKTLGYDTCTSGRVCGRVDRTCSPSTCSGCCDVENGVRYCLSGTEPTACGTSGGRCSDCSVDGRTCSSTGSCGTQKCNPSNCNGCCVGDRCLAGTVSTACGDGGEKCSACANGQRCLPSTSGGGQCGGTTDACGPSNCKGCCDASGRCVLANDESACGILGVFCDRCSANETCSPKGVCTPRIPPTKCGPNNCAGCCLGDMCIETPDDKACGIKGQACKACGSTETCSDTGTCVTPPNTCGPKSCGGCCVGDFCAPGNENTACGGKGSVCVNCTNQGGTCENGACKVPPCGPATCPNGCCSGNQCIPNGNLDSACGRGGAACSDCTSSGDICQGRQCVEKCGPNNCSGCCRANNTCNTSGIENTSCGQFGAACDNCSASGSFCNGLVSPRQCNNKQTTCPAPYASCGSSVRTPVTTPLQSVCSDAVLDDVGTACAAGPNTTACVTAFSNLATSCRSCLDRFNYPFAQKTGLYACAASLVNASCRHAMGCATECADTSCSQCGGSAESQCYALVNGVGQCSSYDTAASCADGALSGGTCSQFSYANFGAWLRSVGDVFCGNGP